MKLSEIQSEMKIEEGYSVRVSQSDSPYIMLVFGQEFGTRAASFDYPNLSAKENRIHEFKRYLKSGGKRWTAKAGVDFYFAVPKSAVEIIPEKGRPPRVGVD